MVAEGVLLLEEMFDIEGGGSGGDEGGDGMVGEDDGEGITGEDGNEATMVIDGVDDGIKEVVNNLGELFGAVFAMLHEGLGEIGEADDVEEEGGGGELAVGTAVFILF